MMTTEHIGAHIARQYAGEIIEGYYLRSDGSTDFLWKFDGVDDPSIPSKYLSVRLSAEETKSVFQRDAAHVGILEPVRATLRTPEAHILQNVFEGDDQRGVASFIIPREGTEEEFLDALDAAPVTTIHALMMERRKDLARVRALRVAAEETAEVLWPISNVRSWNLRRKIRKLEAKIESEVDSEDRIAAVNDEHGREMKAAFRRAHA